MGRKKMKIRLRFSLASFRPGRNISQQRFSITEAALLLMMAYIASRGLGVIRQTIFNALFGTGPEANAYYAAVRLPDTLFNLIAGGALSYALIPVFVSYEKNHGRREAWRLISLVFNVLIVVLTAFVLLGEFLAPAFVAKLLVPGYPPSEQALVTVLTRIMLVQPLILGLGTIATAILSSKRQFLLPALSIVIYNFGVIGGLLFSLAVPGVGILGPTYGVLVAGACQVIIQVPGLVKQGLRYTFIWDLKHSGLHEVIRLLVPNTLSVAIASIAILLGIAYASYLPDQASLAALHNAQLLFDKSVTRRKPL
jgi:putative peptidoglycan lipid II flippase